MNRRSFLRGLLGTAAVVALPVPAKSLAFPPFYEHPSVLSLGPRPMPVDFGRIRGRRFIMASGEDLAAACARGDLQAIALRASAKALRLGVDRAAAEILNRGMGNLLGFPTPDHKSSGHGKAT